MGFIFFRMTIKNQIVRLHRWFGLVMCLFFTAWFISGFVMMYVDFPQYRTKERLARQQPLSLNAVTFPPGQLLHSLKQDKAWKQVWINMLLNRPVIRLQDNEGELLMFYADNGLPVPNISSDEAATIARNYFSGRYWPSRIEAISELDQWIPRSSFLVHMPIYRASMDDPDKTVIYISSITGEIIQLHTQSERILAWCGPIIHWIYPKELILRRPLWRGVVIFFSSLGIVASVTGIVVGIIRVKKNKRGYVSPYRQKWFRWHHYTGFIFGLFVCTWVFSGLLSMSPFDWSPDVEISEQDNRQLQGGDLQIRSFTQPAAVAFATINPAFSPVEIEFMRFQGKDYYIIYNSKGQKLMSVADTVCKHVIPSLPEADIIRAIRSLHPNDHPSDIGLIHHEDNYYYTKHNDIQLPVLRIKYGSANQTWYYADEVTGKILLKNNASSRMNRWLYHGLHSLDFFNLQHRRPVWDLLMIFLLTGGTALSITGLVIAWKYARRMKK